MYVVLPIWLLAGVADWTAHRRTHIEQNSGTFESALHIALLAEMAIPIVAALLMRLNAAFFLISIIALVIHQITIYIDLKYSYTRREISPFEQMIHGVQEIMPLTGLLMLASLHWQQFIALFGAGPESADFTISAKDTPLPVWYTLTVIVAGFGVVLLFVEELIRGLRYKNHHDDTRANMTLGSETT